MKKIFERSVVSYDRALYRYSVRFFMNVYLLVLKSVSLLRFIHKRKQDAELEILLTGNFYSDNWIYAQLRPLSLSSRVRRIRIVAEKEVPKLDKVTAVYPPKILSRLIGKDIARLVTFIWLGLFTKSDVIGGFHLLINGMLAILIGRFARVRSLYVCGGGPREVAGGGYACENRIFGKLGVPDMMVQRQLLDVVACADITVARGQRTIDFFLENGANGNYHILTAGIDGSYFKPVNSKKEYDLVFVGRLTEVKRVDTFLRAVLVVRQSLPTVKAMIIGDGPLIHDLEALTSELGISDNISFLGHCDNVELLIPKARIFVLTSDSEGLSQAMIQAMLCGLPAVASDVGDLNELIDENENGYLIGERTPEAFAEAIVRILELGEGKMREMSIRARQSAMRCDINSVAKNWDRILGGK